MKKLFFLCLSIFVLEGLWSCGQSGRLYLPVKPVVEPVKDSKTTHEHA